MDFVQWVNTVGLGITAVGTYLQLKKDTSTLSYSAVAFTWVMTLIPAGRIYGWW